MPIPVLLVHELFALGKNNSKCHNPYVVLYIHENLKVHLSKYDKLNFIVSSLYHTLFENYGRDYNPTTGNEYLFWTCDQFANQATILHLHAIES